MKKGRQEVPAILKHAELAQSVKDDFKLNLQKQVAKRIRAHKYTLKMIESREKDDRMTKALKTLKNKSLAYLSAYDCIREDIFI